MEDRIDPVRARTSTDLTGAISSISKIFTTMNWIATINSTKVSSSLTDFCRSLAVLPYFSLPNYPIGDGNIRRRKELVAPFDTVKKKYYDLFPDDRQTYLNDYRRGMLDSCTRLVRSLTDAGEWYRAPVDRFIACMARRLADSEKEMTLDEAFELALQDKKYEEEARRIEFKVQKEQAEVCD